MKIGVSGPFTGPRSTYGDLLKGAIHRAAAEAGSAFEWIFLDDAATPDVAEAAAMELCREGVAAVIGHFNSACAYRVLPLYRAAEIPFLAPASTNPGLTVEGGGWLLRLCPHDGQQRDAVLRFAAQQGCRSLHLLADETFYGRSLVEGFPERAEDLHISRFESVSEEMLDADIVFFAGAHFNGAAAVRRLRALGYKGLFVASDDSCIEEFIELAGPAAEGAYALGFTETYEETSYAAASLLWKILANAPDLRGPDLLRRLHEGADRLAFTPQGERSGMEWALHQVQGHQFVR